jgi:hypothetical protein
MKSRILIFIVIILLVPLLAGATPLNLALKMGAGCPFKPGPKLERCNPVIIHSDSNPGDLILRHLPLASISSNLPAFPKIQVVGVITAFSLDALTISPLRC